MTSAQNRSLRNVLRKYLEVFRISLKAQFVYRFDIIVNIVFPVATVLFAYIIWKAIFGQNQMVGGFTFQSMLSYYIVNSFLAGMDKSAKISEEICDQVMKGSFSKYIVIPINIQGYLMVRNLGMVLFHLVFNLVASFIWIFIFQIDFVLTTDPLQLLCAVAMWLLGMIFMAQFHFFIGILSFKYTTVTSFRIIASNIVEFVSGTMVPLILLPEMLLSFLRILPFYYTAYLPSMLLIGRNPEEAVPGLLIIAGWVIGFAVLNKVTYKRMRLLYEGVGI